MGGGGRPSQGFYIYNTEIFMPQTGFESVLSVLDRSRHVCHLDSMIGPLITVYVLITFKLFISWCGWLVYSCCSQLEHRAYVKLFVSLQFFNRRHSVGLFGRVISPSQGRYLTQTDIHALSGIRTHDLSVRGSEDCSCLRPRGHCDRLKMV
jgi:hypothetical protein